MSSEHPLLAVRPDGTTTWIENNYEAIKAALDGATLDAISLTMLDEEADYFVDDNGMVNGLPLNVCASMLAGVALYGPVVLTGYPDANGDTTPPPQRTAKALENMAAVWRSVVEDATSKNQDVLPRADPDAVPPPTFIPMTDEEFDKWLRSR